MILSREYSTNVTLSPKENASLKVCYQLFKELDKNFNDNMRLISPKTGEVILCSEFSRICGILSGVSNNDQWKVELEN